MENNTLRGYNNHIPVNCVDRGPGFIEKYPQRSESSHSGSLASSDSSISVSATDSSKKMLYENSLSILPNAPNSPKRPPFPRPTDPSHIYSIPLKNSRLFYNILFEDQRPQAIPDYTYLDSAAMSCSFMPTQCDTKCNPSKQTTGEEGSSLKCNNKRKSMCPLCGLEGSAETIQSHMEDCEGIETSVCGQCTEIVHRGILSYHLQYVCSKRQVFCKSCGQNFVADKIQGHQSNCNLSNKAWANESSLSPHSTVDKHTNQQNEKTSCDPTSSICQQINNSKTKLMPRARSSDTFEHPGKLQGHHPIQIDGSPALSFVGNMRGHSTTPAVHHGDPSGAFANVGYGALFAKLEMLNKSVEGNSEPDEHTDQQQTVIFPCIFRDAGCHFQGTHYALSKHLDESMKLHLAMTYSVMQHQQKQLLMVTSALAATLNPNIDGSLIWKVRNFSERLLDAKSGKRTEFHSPVFYTSRYGYKMTLVLYPDGIGSAKGSHISIFLKVLRGDFDQFLTWPFPHTLKIALLSQDQTRQHIVQRINQKFNVLNETASSSNGSHGSRDHSSPTTNHSSSSSQPTLIGLTKFVSQELLLSSQQYLMEDTLCICGSVVNSDSNSNFKQPEIFPRTSEI